MTRSTSVHCQSSQVRSDNLIICSLSIWLMVTRYKGAAAPVEWWMAWCLTEAEAVCPLHSSSPTWSPSSHLCQCWDPGQVSGRDSRSTLRRLCYRYSHFTPHADFGTKVLLSWRFCKLSSYKTSLVLQTQAFNAIFGWWDLYWRWEEEKVQVTKSKIPLREKVPHIW